MLGSTWGKGLYYFWDLFHPHCHYLDTLTLFPASGITWTLQSSKPINRQNLKFILGIKSFINESVSPNAQTMKTFSARCSREHLGSENPAYYIFCVEFQHGSTHERPWEVLRWRNLFDIGSFIHSNTCWVSTDVILGTRALAINRIHIVFCFNWGEQITHK